MVYASWTATGRALIDYLATEIPLAPDEVYSYEALTSPHVRGLNIAPALYSRIMRHFRDAGYRRVVKAIMPENIPAFRANEKVAARPFGVMGYVKVGLWRRDFCRVRRGSLPPGETPAAYGPAYWDSVVRKFDDKKYHLDAFLAELKRQAHLSLIQRWGACQQRAGCSRPICSRRRLDSMGSSWIWPAVWPSAWMCRRSLPAGHEAETRTG